MRLIVRNVLSAQSCDFDSFHSSDYVPSVPSRNARAIWGSESLHKKICFRFVSQFMQRRIRHGHNGKRAILSPQGHDNSLALLSHMMAVP